MIKYELLTERLRQRLTCPGPRRENKLPPLVTIAREEGCSLTTVQRAVQVLKKEGLIVTRAGQGTFLASEFPSARLKEQRSPAVHAAGGLATEALPLRFICFAGLFESLMSDPYGSALFSGLEGIITQRGHPIQFQNVVVQRRLMPLRPENLAQRVCGTVVLNCCNEGYLAYLAGHCRPLVSVDRDATPWNVPSIVFDCRAGALLAATRVIECGHRAIAYLGSELTLPGGKDPAVRERFEGFRLAHLARGLSLREELCQPVAALQSDEIEKALDALLGRGVPFTALLAYDENVAFIALACLQRRGMRVPEDCSVVSAGALASNGTIAGARFSMAEIPVRAWAMLEAAGTQMREEGGRGEFEPATAELAVIAPEFDAGTTLERQVKG